jgi:hypothetical protein
VTGHDFSRTLVRDERFKVLPPDAVVTARGSYTVEATLLDPLQYRVRCDRAESRRLPGGQQNGLLRRHVVPPCRDYMEPTSQ